LKACIQSSDACTHKLAAFLSGDIDTIGSWSSDKADTVKPRIPHAPAPLMADKADSAPSSRSSDSTVADGNTHAAVVAVAQRVSDFRLRRTRPAASSNGAADMLNSVVPTMSIAEKQDASTSVGVSNGLCRELHGCTPGSELA